MPTKAKAPAQCSNTTRGKTSTTTVAKQMEPWHAQDTSSPSEFQHNCSGHVGCSSNRSPQQSRSAEAGQTDRPTSDAGSSPSGAGRSGGVAMMPSLPDPDKYWPSLPTIPRIMFDWLLGKGVAPLSVGSVINNPLKFAHGHCAADGWFEADASGQACFAILVEDLAGAIDIAFWDPRSGRTATLLNYGFALGEEQIDNPGVCAFGGALKVWRTPLEWFQAGRGGIVILKPVMAWYRLLHVDRIEACDHQHATHLRNLLRPPRGPEVHTPRVRIAA